MAPTQSGCRLVIAQTWPGIWGRPRRSERPAQLIPRAAQSLSNACRHCDRRRVAAGFHKLQVAHRDVGLLGERFLGQARGGAQAADVLAKFISRSSRHWTDSQRFKLFDPEGCFVFFFQARSQPPSTPGCSTTPPRRKPPACRNTTCKFRSVAVDPRYWNHR